MHDFYFILEQDEEDFPSSLFLKNLSLEQKYNVPVSPSGQMNS